MSARAYDVILSVNSVSGFVNGNAVVGVTSGTTGVIANVNPTDNTLKIKKNNLLQDFKAAESIRSNSITTSGSSTLTTTPFLSNTFSGNSTTATATISSIAQSNFKAAKNAFTQNPIVRLYTIYYPGEWYPPNVKGNPTGQGEGKAWPNGFPVRFAEVNGDLGSDILYNVSYGNDSYIPFPVNMSALAQGSEGKIDELSLTVFNVDDIITRITEDPFLAGNNSSNSVQAIVNGELVHGIDPRTVNANPSDFGSAGTEGFDVLTRARANGLAYSSSIQDTYGSANASFDRTQTLSVGGTWVEQKLDTRDLLGGVVEVKTTFANFLDYWPEYSVVRSVRSNVVEVHNSLPYRVGDTVRAKNSATTATIQAIEEESFLFLSNELDAGTSFNEPIYIVNADSDTESYIEDKFKIDQLEGLADSVATFNLISWLQYFKLATPKRKFYKNTCQWVYKGAECQYPGPGGLSIPGTSKTSNANPIAANNQTASAGGDVCGKSIISCTIRNNQIHFGGFPATGRTIPRT
jgi:phage-related protein